MTINNAIASLAVKDLKASVIWYEKVFGRSADSTLGRPLNSLLVTFFQAMGLAPSDYQRFGKLGFGEYDRHHAAHTAHYAPFKTDVAKNEPLPFLYV